MSKESFKRKLIAAYKKEWLLFLQKVYNIPPKIAGIAYREMWEMAVKYTYAKQIK